jgi:hypothetical protein
VTRSLQMLKPVLPQRYGGGRVNSMTALFWLGVFAVLLQFLLPYVVLDAIGVNTQALKEHPSTILVLICGIYALLRGTIPLHQQCRREPGLMMYVFAIPVLNIYSAWFTGISGAALYAESYMSAGMLALMLGSASSQQKRLLAKILITLCVINVLVAVYESATATNWFPVIIDPDAPILNDVVDFRANAFYNHPLTASLITSMAVYLLFGMRMRLIYRGPIFGLLLIGLLAFGGRTALGVTLIVSVLTAAYLLLAGIIRRNLTLEFVAGIVLAAIVIPTLIGIVITQTSIADRIMDTLYYDGSAETRATQFEVFKYLTLQNWLFGISHENLDLLKYQIGLGGKETDIENFWILMLLNLGVMGFGVFLAVFGAFLYYLGRQTRSMYGWLLVISALIIDSGSNSLGSKSADLFIEVAFVMALSGYDGYIPNARASVLRHVSSHLLRSSGALAAVATTRSRALRILGSRTV